MPDPKTFHPHTMLAPSYYKGVIFALIEGLHLRLNSRGIADYLNAKGLRQPNSKPWTAESLKHALYRLKNSTTHPNRLHSMMLKMVFAGEVTVSQVQILFESRRPGAVA